MKFEELKVENFKERIAEAVQQKEEIMLYAFAPHNLIYKGKGNINSPLAKRLGYDIYNTYDFGGGIVAAQGDIVLVIIKQEGWEIGKNIIEYATKKLREEFGLNAEFIDNDILVDKKYKVGSFSSTNIGDRYIYTGVQICFHADPDIITQICLKNSPNKIPRGLSYYNIANTDLMPFVLGFCDEYLKKLPTEVNL